MIGARGAERRVERSLDRVLASPAPGTVRVERELGELRMVVFSDHHKGRRDGADDFARCEPAYRAALEFYRRSGYELVILGDSEELWESYPFWVFRAYRETLAAEAAFARSAGRGYFRVWGNHDDLWRSRVPARRYFGALAGGEGFPEGVVVSIVVSGGEIGRCLLVHGHQGTLDGDVFASAGRFLALHVYRHLQRMLRFSTSTPATDFAIRYRHERTLEGWIAARSGLLLVTGHTHRALFAGGRDGLSRGDAWARAFNAGCCSYADGSVTGLELAGGEIRLVSWSTGGQAEPETTRAAPLAAVFASA